MILQSLVHYYELLANDENSDIPRLGYSRASVSYAINLSLQGELLNLIPLRISVKRGKKHVEVPQSMVVPEQEKKTSGVKSNFLCENSSYIFGIDNKGKPERAKECFKAFQKLHLDVLGNIDYDIARAIIRFIETWDADKPLEHPALREYMEDLPAANLVFKIEGGEYAHENKEIRRAWEKYKNSSGSSNTMQCLVTGERSEIAKIHPNIQGVKGAKSTGAAIVSFNKRAYESYGKDELQGMNAPVSEYATFAYTTVLNYLLADTAHKLYLGDSSIVFWAESPKSLYRNFMSLYLNGGESSLADNYTPDEEATREVKSILEKIAQGKPIGDLSEVFDKKTTFHILALSPNAARLAVRFFLTDSFDGFVDKVAKHYQDLAIEKQFSNESDNIPVWRLLNETVSPNSKDKAASPLMSGAVMRSILTGGPYPTSLYQSIMIRIKAERKINYYKASIIKACLLRNTETVNNFKEVLVMSLNEQSEKKAYILGRIFALLEKAQQDANPGIITTIKDKFFTSACASPGSIFPTLLRLSQHHISKAKYGYANDKEICNILDKLEVENEPYPSHLSLEEQGIFVLGYYHQKNALYKKNN